MWFQSLGWEVPLENETKTHPSILAWRSPMDRGAWRATVLGVAKSWTRLKWPSMHYSFVRYYHWGKLGEGYSRAIFTHKTSNIKHVRISPTATYSTPAGCPAIQFSFDTISLRLESHPTSSRLSLMRLPPLQKPTASLRPPITSGWPAIRQGLPWLPPQTWYFAR